MIKTMNVGVRFVREEISSSPPLARSSHSFGDFWPLLSVPFVIFILFKKILSLFPELVLICFWLFVYSFDLFV